MRKRRGQPVHGWIVIDKPTGPTSARVVSRVRRALDAAKAGHAGTLDPMASGVLPIALGAATKTVPYVMDGCKTYRFTVRWGEARDTDDAEGEVTATSEVRPGQADIEAVLGGFTGDVLQTPPVYSAVKIDGERSYALARAQKPVTPEPRRVRIDRLELIGCADADHATFLLECGKGAYVRSLARDIAVRLGTVGHVAEIRRTRVGPFAESDAISLDKLERLGHSPRPLHLVRPVETALDDIPALALTETQAGYLKTGRPLRVRGSDGRAFADIGGFDTGDIVCATAGGRAIALARFTGETIQPLRVLDLT